MLTYLVTVTGRRSTAATDIDSGRAVVTVAAHTRDDAAAQVRRAETLIVTRSGRTTTYDEFTIVGKPQRIGRS